MPRTLAELELDLIGDIARFYNDPLGFVKYAFHWGEGDLADSAGPREWQAAYLDRIGRRLRELPATNYAPIQEAVASGHDIGKTSLISMLIAWIMSTCVDARGICTAGTDAQLKTKTWPELAIWHRRLINRHWFIHTATAFHSSDKTHERTWRFDAIPWSENRTEAFAGLHNKRKRAAIIVDEASQIPFEIAEVMSGAMTDADTELLWLPFGNPTRNTGWFRECFGRFRHRWSEGNPLQLDSRTVEGTNKETFKRWIEDYGEDSDYVRVRVRGMFPRASSLQFIDGDLVHEAMNREPRWNKDDALVMALDIARGGDDQNVFTIRRGLDMKSIPQIVIPGSETKDSMRLVDKAVRLVEQYKPDVFFGDATGVGGPVLDRLRQLRVNVVQIQFGAASPDPKYANMRAYIWGRLRDLMEQGLAVEDNPALEADLTGVEYTHNNRDQLVLEKKEHMKERGLASPDRGDSAAMCAMPFFGIGNHLPAGLKKEPQRVAGGDWDPYT